MHESDVRKRLDIKLGFSCNNNCIFCAQAHKKHLGDRSTEELKKEIISGFQDGCREIILTGGEPLIRKDIFELVSHARRTGFEVIQVQTNGRMLSYENFAKKLIDAGVSEFSPALHGHTAELHELNTRVKGSFSQTLQGIKNLRKLNSYIVTNSVITKFNYKHLPEIVSLLAELGVDQFQLAFVHPVGNAWKNFDLVVPRKLDTKPFIHSALEVAKAHGFDCGTAMVEAFPYCFMEGYENFCSENFIPSSEVREKEIVIKEFEIWRKERGKVKFAQCKKCKYDSVCEGPWKEYAEKFGSEEFKAVF